jgi:DNA-directed RNA polymerase subunit alpha
MSRVPKLSEVPDGMNRSIDEIGLSSRSRNALTKANVHRLNELVLKTEGALRAVRNLGKKSISEIKQVLSAMGLTLAIP